MKKFATIFLTMLCVVCCMSALTACEKPDKEPEEAATQGLSYELSEDNESYTVVGIGSYDGNNLVIPSKYEGKPVTSIGQAAFYDCKKLTSVTIPDSVTSIGNDAFEGCLIKKASIPSIATPYINNETLETVTITSGDEIPDSAFEDCKKLTSVTIGKNVSSFGDNAFKGCSGLKNLYIEDLSAWCNIEFNGFMSNPLYYAENFYLNEKLVTELVIPNNVTSIGDYVFNSYEKLTSVTLPNSITSIGDSAFLDCSGLTSVTLSGSVTSIGHEAFSGCKSLTSIEIPNSVTFIGAASFYNCEMLTSITITDNVNYIGSYAFAGCSKLKEVIFTDTSTWYEDNRVIDVTNPSKNAERVIFDFYGYPLIKK